MKTAQKIIEDTHGKVKHLKSKTGYKLVILLAILVVGYFSWTKSHKAPNPMGAYGPTEVSVMVIKKENVQLFMELPGRVAAHKISEVRPQVNGIIKQQKFAEGFFVKAGQQLYQIDPTLYQIALNNASANLKTIGAKRDRYKILLAEDAVSKQEFDDIAAAFAQAEADFKTAKTNLNYAKVCAPISGYIGKSNVTEGALAVASQATILTTITELDPIYVDMVQSSKEASKLSDQKEITVSVSIDNMTYEDLGTLKFSEVFVDESTDSVRLRSLFSNKNHKLLPGMFVNAKLHLKPIEAITVPQKATSRTPSGGLVVWVVDNDNIAKSRNIKEGQIYNDSWIVLDGLNEGDSVIYEGFQKITEGAKVNPIPVNITEKSD